MADSAEKLGNDEPDLDHLHDDLEEVRRYADDVASASGSLREHRKHLIDSRGYNKKALGFLYQIWKLPDEKYQDFMRTFGDGLAQIDQARKQRMTKDMFEEGSETDHEVPEDDDGPDPDFGDEVDTYVEGNTEHDPEEEEDIDDLRAQAKELGISAPHNIGADKLRQKIAEAT